MSTIASNSTALPAALELGTTYGPSLIGNTFGVMIFGIALIQVAWYYTHFPKDHIFLKLYVAILFCLGASHELITFLGNYRTVISRFGDITFTLQIHPSAVYQILVTSMVGAMVQCFFVYRIVAFANNVFVKYGIPILLSPLIAWQIVGTAIYDHRGLGFKSTVQLNSLRGIGISISGAQCIVDIAIALTVSILMYTRKTGKKATDRLLLNLIIASINTGACTAMLAIAVVVAICVNPPTDLIYATPYLMLSSMYINTVLLNLNIRRCLLNQRDGGGDPGNANPNEGDMPIVSIERETKFNSDTLDSDTVGGTISVGDHEHIHDRV